MIKQRRVLGILGICLPILTIIFSIFGFQYFDMPFFVENISATHYYNSYLFFEGIIIAVGLFLITYEGYDIKDKWITTIGGISAIIIAFFPYQPPNAMITNPWNFLMISPKITEIFHLIGAVTFFACLFFMQTFQFTKFDFITKEKEKRNLLYRICGWITLSAVIIGTGMDRMDIIGLPHITAGIFGFSFIGEAISLFAFGIAWLVKGETFLKDKE
jgi:hypothetical protein